MTPPIIPTDPDWMADALCPQITTEMAIWFPARGSCSSEARRICSLCDVQEQCLAFAMSMPIGTPGVYAGTTETDRANLGRTAA